MLLTPFFDNANDWVIHLDGVNGASGNSGKTYALAKDTWDNAVAAVPAGGTIIVWPGTYVGGTSTLTKPIHVVGTSKSSCIIKEAYSGKIYLAGIRLAAGSDGSSFSNISLKAVVEEEDGVAVEAPLENLTFENCILEGKGSGSLGFNALGSAVNNLRMIDVDVIAEAMAISINAASVNAFYLRTNFHSIGTLASYAYYGGGKNIVCSDCNFYISRTALAAGTIAGIGLTAGGGITLNNCSIYCTAAGVTAGGTIAGFHLTENSGVILKSCILRLEADGGDVYGIRASNGKLLLVHTVIVLVISGTDNDYDIHQSGAATVTVMGAEHDKTNTSGTIKYVDTNTQTVQDGQPLSASDIASAILSDASNLLTTDEDGRVDVSKIEGVDATEQMVTAVLDEVLTTHTTADSLGEILQFLNNVAEANSTIITTTTPWRLRITHKTTGAVLVEKDLYDKDGNPIISITTIIGRHTEP